MEDTPTLVQKLAAEAIGTFVLVFIGVGAAARGLGAQDLTSVALAFGIAIVAMVYTFGRISGGHFNPAVSVGAALSGRISWIEAAYYSGAQIVGGLVGGLALVVISLAGDTGYEFGDPIGANGYGDNGHIDLLGALLIEIVLTFIFLVVILGVTDERNQHPALAPLAIGLTLAGIHMASLSATSTSVNPARSIGVAFFSGGDAIIQLWAFIVAPLIGAAAAGLAYPALFGRHGDPVPGSGLNFSKPAAVPGYGQPDQFQQQWNQQDYGQAGYGQPAQGYGQAAPAEQPIIQDGWQWDPAAQQWIPAQQPPAPAPAPSYDDAGFQRPADPAAPAAPSAPQQGSWPAPDAPGGSDPEGPAGQTQVRPPS